MTPESKQGLSLGLQRNTRTGSGDDSVVQPGEYANSMASADKMTTLIPTEKGFTINGKDLFAGTTPVSFYQSYLALKADGTVIVYSDSTKNATVVAKGRAAGPTSNGNLVLTNDGQLLLGGSTVSFTVISTDFGVMENLVGCTFLAEQEKFVGQLQPGQCAHLMYSPDHNTLLMPASDGWTLGGKSLFKSPVPVSFYGSFLVYNYDGTIAIYDNSAAGSKVVATGKPSSQTTDTGLTLTNDGQLQIGTSSVTFTAAAH